jgi:perosamine synthetase
MEWGKNVMIIFSSLRNYLEKHIGSQYAMATSSCTGAIHLALMAMGIKAGDEVIVS